MKLDRLIRWNAMLEADQAEPIALVGWKDGLPLIGIEGHWMNIAVYKTDRCPMDRFRMIIASLNEALNQPGARAPTAIEVSQ
jgi:hypothetical protein